MPGSLLNPDNRLLSGLVGDLSLYGATVTPANAPLVAADSTEPAETTTTPSAGPIISLPASGEPASPVALDATDQPHAQPVPSGSVAPAAVTPGGSTADVAATAVSPIAPADIGSGSVANTSPTTTASDVVPQTAAVATPLAPADLPASLLAPTLAIPTDATTIVSTASPALLDADSNRVAEATGAVATLANHGDDALDTAVANIVSDLDGAQDAVSAAIGATMDALVAADPVPVVSAAEATIASSTSAANDLLTDFAGTNPAAGVATLVEIVAAADQLDLSQVTAPEMPDAGSIVDLLATDIADAPLIADVKSPLTDPDDGHTGLFGL